MRRGERLAGAPIYRGRWAGIIALWFSGYLAGEMDIGFLWEWVINPLQGQQTNLVSRNWVVDGVLGSLALTLLVYGVLSIDQYGRNAWFTWAPDGTLWGGIPREAVNRTPVARPLVLWLRKKLGKT